MDLRRIATCVCAILQLAGQDDNLNIFLSTWLKPKTTQRKQKNMKLMKSQCLCNILCVCAFEMDWCKLPTFHFVLRGFLGEYWCTDRQTRLDRYDSSKNEWSLADKLTAYFTYCLHCNLWLTLGCSKTGLGCKIWLHNSNGDIHYRDNLWS